MRFIASSQAFVTMLLVGAGMADAGELTITDPANGPYQFGAYQIFFPTGVTVAYDGVAGSFNNGKTPYSGTLSITANFTSNAPLTIEFMQINTTNVTNFGTSSAGLRLALTSAISNNTPNSPWAGFTYTLQDNTDLTNVNVGNTGTHDANAHFHPQVTTPSGNNTYSVTDFSVTSDVDNTNFIGLGNGTLNPGDEPFGLSNALIHERNYLDNSGNPVLRSFDLILTPTPVPEPATLILAGIGALSIVGFAWARRWGSSNRPCLS